MRRERSHWRATRAPPPRCGRRCGERQAQRPCAWSAGRWGSSRASPGLTSRQRRAYSRLQWKDVCQEEASMSVTEVAIEAPAEIRHGDVVVSDGVRIHYQEAGAGIPVVLLHGYTSCCDASWFTDGMAKELARTHRVIGIDARGHGRSDKPHDPAKYPGDRMASDVIEVLDRLGIARAHFHGYSMGGGLVAQLMARAPERFTTAGFGGSGVRETDEALAAKAAELDPKGVDPDQDRGRATLAARPDR